MFKTYLSKYDSNKSVKDKAYELASLLKSTCKVYTRDDGKYYIYDGYKWFDVELGEYVSEPVAVVEDIDFREVPTKPMKTVPLRRCSYTIGNRKVAPIFDLDNGTCSLLGIMFDDLGGMLKVMDSGTVRVFSYGLRGSELYFEEV